MSSLIDEIRTARLASEEARTHEAAIELRNCKDREQMARTGLTALDELETGESRYTLPGFDRPEAPSENSNGQAGDGKPPVEQAVKGRRRRTRPRESRSHPQAGPATRAASREALAPPGRLRDWPALRAFHSGRRSAASRGIPQATEGDWHSGRRSGRMKARPRPSGRDLAGGSTLSEQTDRTQDSRSGTAGGGDSGPVEHALDLDRVPRLARSGRMPVFIKLLGDRQQSQSLTPEFLHILR